MNEISREASDKRAASLRRWNALYSKTSVLPAEILSLIFQNIYPSSYEDLDMHGQLVVFHSSDGCDSPIFLGSISHAWRQVAWSTPQLWTGLSITAPRPGHNNAQNLASLLDLFFTNVGGLSLFLYIEFCGQRLDIPENVPTTQVFFREEILRKLGALDLYDPPYSWLCRLCGPFPRLVKISIFIGGWWADGGDIDDIDSALVANYPFITNAPMLREISLDCMDAPPPKAPWPSITVLKLRQVSAAIAFQFLLHCPNLVEFYYIPEFAVFQDDDDDGEHDELPDIPDILTLYHLETLSSSFYHLPDSFLERIRLPALRSLTWDQRERPDTGMISQGIRRFFQNLSDAPLTTLRLWGIFDLDINLIKHIYHQIPGIESVSFWHCDEATVRVVFASLTPGWEAEGSGDKRQFLTKLKRLEVRVGDPYGGFGGSRASETVGDLVADLLIGRARVDFDSSVCINLIFSMKTRWMPETKEMLRELSHAGAKVQLLENGKQVDWL